MNNAMSWLGSTAQATINYSPRKSCTFKPSGAEASCFGGKVVCKFDLTRLEACLRSVPFPCLECLGVSTETKKTENLEAPGGQST